MTKLRLIDTPAEIAEQIRDLIARGVLAPGVHLIPARIAEQIRDLTVRGALAPGVQMTTLTDLKTFSLSRMPVREALKLLVGEGVVIQDQNRGFFVAPLSSDEASQLYRLRHLIEAELLATLVWPKPEQLEALRMHLREIEHGMEHRDVIEQAKAIREFHRMIFELSPKQILIREALRIWTLCDRYRSVLIAAFSHKSMDTATHLFEALKTQDRNRLLATFAADLHEIERDLLRA